MTSLKVLDPTHEYSLSEHETAERLPSLDGKTIGIIDNGKANTDVIFHAIRNRLYDEDVKDTLHLQKRSSSHAITNEEAEEFAQSCHGVITGIGD